MKLEEKGRFAPPPLLPEHAQNVPVGLASWDGVEARTPWQRGDESVVDGADFYVGDGGLVHLHLDGTAHVAAPRALRDALIAGGFAAPFRWSAEFVVVPVERAADVARALWVFELRYDALRGADVKTLVAKVAAARAAAADAT